MSEYSLAEFLERWKGVKDSSARLVGPSLVDRIALCERDEPGFTKRLIDSLDALMPAGAGRAAFDTSLWMRPKQQAVLASRSQVVFFCGGRGGGKTAVGSAWILQRLYRGARNLVAVGPSENDVYQYMLGGNDRLSDGHHGSGILDILPPWVKWEVKNEVNKVLFPQYQAVLHLHSAHLPKFRGPNVDSVWGDEPIKWKYPDELMLNLGLACRALGKVNYQTLYTSSPVQRTFMRDLVMDSNCETFHSVSDENRGNLPGAWFDAQHTKLGSSVQGLEELGGELGIEQEGAMFSLFNIDAHRIAEAPKLDRIAVGVDPAASTGPKSDATGIVVLGRKGDAASGHGYVLADATGRHSWEDRGRIPLELAMKWGASCIVVEKNRVGDGAAGSVRAAAASLGWKVEPRPGSKALLDLVRDGRRIQIVEVLAMGDKANRAGPLGTMYQVGRMHHVGPRGTLDRLENEMASFDPSSNGASPNGLDALTHAATELFELDRVPTTNGADAMRGMAALNDRLQASAPVHGTKRLPMGGGYGRRGF